MNHLGLSLLLSIALSITSARADDGVLRMRAAQGPYLVAIFTSPDLCQDRPSEINVLVQEPDSNNAILDADVIVTFSPPSISVTPTNDPICGGRSMAGMETAPEPITVIASRGNSRNKLFYATQVSFPTAGDWRMQISINHADKAVKFLCRLPVTPPPHELTALIPYLCLPPVLLGLFTLNHRLRTRLRGIGSSQPLL